MYQIGTLCKLKFITGSRDAGSYASLWTSIIRPLLDCGDWFMHPYGFKFDIEYLYYDKQSEQIRLVYVPTNKNVSTHDNFKEMAADITRIISVDDPALENKILRAIMKNSNPNELMEILRTFTSAQSYRVNEGLKIPSDELKVADNIRAYGESQSTTDIIIEISDKTSRAKDKKKPSGVFGGWSGKKKPQSEKAPDMKRNIQAESVKLHDIQEESVGDADAVLKNIGQSNLPALIELNIKDGEVFSIGRYDAAVGRVQSSFEFDRTTKAVSRRHCVIEKEDAKYVITDLASGAGTFINGEKLSPNTPCVLVTGNKVSFGNFGADYIFQVM